MPEAIIGPVVGSVVGGLLGGDDAQASASREPWAPAQPWLKDQIARGQELQRFYEQNPFSPQSMTAYQNIFSDLDSMRTGLIPNIMGLSSNIMQGGYQVPQLSRPGTAGYGGMQPPQAPAQEIRAAVEPQPARAAVMPNPNEDMVMKAYGSIGRKGFGTDANQIDQGGYDYWMGQLNSGKIAPEQFQGAFNSAVNNYIAEKPNDAVTRVVQRATWPDRFGGGMYGQVDWTRMNRPSAPAQPTGLLADQSSFDGMLEDYLRRQQANASNVY
jgi:hypothetical protein